MNTKLTIQLKKKHLGYCAEFMMSGSMLQYFYIASMVRDQLLAGTFELEDLVSVEILPDDLIDIYTTLGFKPERTGSSMNGDMKQLLLPQLVSLASNSDPNIASSAGYVITQLTAIDTQNINELSTIVNNGINWLTQPQ
jgi:hypothetical protein